MVNFFQTVINSARERAYAEYPIPPVLNQAAHVMKEVHLYWWAFRYYQIAQKASQRDAVNQGNPLVYGAVAHGVAQHFAPAKCLVQMALIAKCADDLFQSYQSVHQAYQKLMEAVQMKYPVYYRQKWLPPTQHLATSISPSFYLELRLMHVKFAHYLVKIVKCTTCLIAQLFQLSMRLRDTYLITTQDSIAQYTACSEIFANWNQYKMHLDHHSRFLFDELKKRQGWTASILRLLSSHQEASSFVSTFQSGLEKLKALASQPLSQAPSVESFLNPIIDSGKITALNLEIKRDFRPSLPPVRYPPWTGERIKSKQLK